MHTALVSVPSLRRLLFLFLFCTALDSLASLRRLDTYPAESLAGLIAGLAAFGHRPPAGWLDAFALHSYVVMGRFSPQELANTVHALSRLGYAPSQAWLANCCRWVRLRSFEWLFRMVG